MIVVYPFSVIDQQLALKNAQWFNELGGCKGHEVLVMHDRRCTTGVVNAIQTEMSMAFDKVYMLPCPAEIDGWPEGANYFFRLAANRLDTKPHTPYFMWMEPDAIPLKAGWLDSIVHEFESVAKPMGKFFMGDRVEVEEIPLHMSGIGIYSLPLHARAGEAYRASETAWDMAAKDQIVPNAHFTKLIEHAWKHPTFTSVSELESQIRPEAVLFHSSKDGSLITLLQSKQGGKPNPRLEASSEVPTEKEPDKPGSPSLTLRPNVTCDIFIRTYEGDYTWMKYCLASIDKYCTGFRRVMVVSPSNPPPWMISRKGVVPLEWKVMPDESEDGYLAQQIAKLYADVILDYQPDYILHVDSDVIFHSPCSPGNFLSKDKVVWYYTPYSEIETPWQPIMEKFMTFMQPNEFMRRFPIMVPRWLYPKVREFCHRIHGVIISDYIRNQPLRAFSEFNALGCFAYFYHKEMFEWVNTIAPALGHMPEPIAKQFHSWGGITPEIQSEIDGYLSGTPEVSGNAPTPVGGGFTDVPEIPAGIKELPSGIWVIENDTHVSKWIEQEQRLDHDQNTLPFIIPLLKEGDVVIDAGAFVGDHTIAYLRKVGPTGTVHAFEPNPLAMKCLKHNLSNCENGGHSYSLCTYEVALGDKSVNDLPLSGNNFNYGGAYLGEHMPVAKVSMMRLDDLNLNPDFIKLDIEGCEVKALIGMQETLRRCNPVMVIEVNEVALGRQGHTVGQLFAQLESHGYKWTIMQENCCATSPMYDIICRSVTKSPEVENGAGALSRCASAPPPVTSPRPIFDMLSAVAFLKNFADTDQNHRLRVMVNLSKAGLTPRHPKKKKKHHETTPPDIPKKAEIQTPTETAPLRKGKRVGRYNSRRLVQAAKSEAGKIGEG